MIRVYLKHGPPINSPAGTEVEPTLFPAPVGCDGRHALEVVGAQGNALACFQLAEVAGYAYGPPKAPGTP